MAITTAVAILAAVIAGAAAFGLAFLVDFLEVLLLIRDFFVTAMVFIPQVGIELLYTLVTASIVPN